MKDNQNIKCLVSKCKFNNNSLNHCNLNEIEINCNCDNEKCNSKEKTICNSYKESRYPLLSFNFLLNY